MVISIYTCDLGGLYVSASSMLDDGLKYRVKSGLELPDLVFRELLMSELLELGFADE